MSGDRELTESEAMAAVHLAAMQETMEHAPDAMTFGEIRALAMTATIAALRELDKKRGLALVPREPSNHMSGCGSDACDIRPSEARAVYRAMLVAHEQEEARRNG